MTTQIRSGTVLPAFRLPLTMATADGLRLVGELATPVDRDPVATLVCLHPLPTHGGMMDSHILRKAAWRLPALAGIAVLRFNTRGTESPAGRSRGGLRRRATPSAPTCAAAVDEAVPRSLPRAVAARLVVRHRAGAAVGLPGAGRRGAILLCRRCTAPTDADLDAWAASGKPVLALVPELDDYLRPDEARQRFARIPQARVVGVDGAQHLWVGEQSVRRVLDEVVAPGRARLLRRCRRRGTVRIRPGTT